MLLSKVVATIGELQHILNVLHTAAAEDVSRSRDIAKKALGGLKGVEAASLRELANPNGRVLGLGFAANPAAFNEPGLAWWYRSQDGGAARPLKVRAKPGAVDFYDYTETEWWTGSILDEKIRIFGPYVDHSWTNAYIVTFARSVVSDGVVLGLVVLDVLVGTLQALWQAPLLQLPKSCSVVNGEGVVIATNDSALMANAVPSQLTESIPVEGTDWSICLARTPG